MPLPPDRARGCQAPPPSPRQKLAEAMFSFTRLISDLPVSPSNARVHTPLGLSSSLLFFPWLFEKVTSETKQSSPASRHGPFCRRCEREEMEKTEGLARSGDAQPKSVYLVRRSPLPVVFFSLHPSLNYFFAVVLGEENGANSKRRDVLNSTLFLSAASPQPPRQAFLRDQRVSKRNFLARWLVSKKSSWIWAMLVFIALIIAFSLCRKRGRSSLSFSSHHLVSSRKQTVKRSKAPVHTDHTGWEMSVTPPPSKESQIKQWHHRRGLL